ncbi:hypothetical protein Tco_1314655 [Tanacetum coccineum]
MLLQNHHIYPTSIHFQTYKLPVLQKDDYGFRGQWRWNYLRFPSSNQNSRQVADEKRKESKKHIDNGCSKDPQTFHGMDDAISVLGTPSRQGLLAMRLKEMQKKAMKMQNSQVSEVPSTALDSKTTATPGLADELYILSLATNADDVDYLLHEDLDQIDDLDLERMDINLADCYDCSKIKKFTEDSASLKVQMKVQAGTQINWLSRLKVEELNHALMAFTVNNEVSMCSKLCLDTYNALQAKYDELQSEFGDQEASLVAHKLAVKKLESQLKASHK